MLVSTLNDLCVRKPPLRGGLEGPTFFYKMIPIVYENRLTVYD